MFDGVNIFENINPLKGSKSGDIWPAGSLWTKLVDIALPFSSVLPIPMLPSLPADILAFSPKFKELELINKSCI